MSMSYQESENFKGMVPTHYLIGDDQTEGHHHDLYLRDDLPIATSTDHNHCHCVEKGPGNSVVCVEELGHTHAKLEIKNAGNYAPRTLA
jgi:hypothetical protein